MARSADVAVNKLGPATVVPGVDLSYIITVTNNGPSDAQNVEIIDPAPAGLQFLTALPVTACTALPNQVVCTVATLPANASTTFTLTASVPEDYNPATDVTNVVTATSTTADPNLFNNTDQTSSRAEPLASLAIVKNGPASVIAGTRLTYTISVNNSGPSTAQNVVIADPTPAGVIGPVSVLGCNNGAFPCVLGSVGVNTAA